ncbi:quinone oxidoreductase PIG3 isoform X1 [Ambystoma mexicanum]|uniref:quinone oxidoreductase PIG3 isoform X1 n=1 Tax=Ambystoma mexicanum TaxID=8296 RepID=UPI0037E85C53
MSSLLSFYCIMAIATLPVTSKQGSYTETPLYSPAPLSHISPDIITNTHAYTDSIHQALLEPLAYTSKPSSTHDRNSKLRARLNKLHETPRRLLLTTKSEMKHQIGNTGYASNHTLASSLTQISVSKTKSSAKNAPNPTHTKEETKDHSYKGALLNARSLVAHALEIADLITENNLDFIAITETWLHQAAGPSLMLAIPDGYTICRQDREGSRGGGIAIISKSSLSLRLAPAQTLQSCEALTAKLLINNNQSLTIHLIYRPPGPLGTFEEDLHKLLTLNAKTTSQLLVLGDFNLGFNDKTDAHAATIAHAINSLGFSQKVNNPTHTKGRILDWVADSNCTTVISSISALSWSDHSLVSFDLLTSQPSSTVVPMALSCPTRNKKNMTMENVIPAILPTLNALPDNSDPGTLVHEYNKIMTDTLDKIAPLKMRTSKPKAHLNKWFTPELKALRLTKRKYESNWKICATAENKANLISISRQYKNAVCLAKRNSYNDRIANSKSSVKELFSILKELESPIAIPDTCTKDQTWCSDIQYALTNKITTLQNKIQLKKDSLKLPTLSPPKATLMPQPTKFSFTKPYTLEIEKIILTLKPSNCKGDICPAQLIKDAARDLSPFISKLVNASFSTGIIPANLKQSWVLPLLKKQTLDPLIPTNYRPITTVPFLLKILDKVAYIQIQNYLELHKLLGSRQSGFRPLHGTETALIDLKAQIDELRDQGKTALLLLLDLSAAFDLVDHKVLCKHLDVAAHFSTQAISWIESFLSERTMRVFSPSAAADPIPITCGVPQGSCVSPTLYNIFTKPLFDDLDNPGITYTNYADDTQILFPLSGDHSEDGELVNRVYLIIQAWMATHGLCLNDDKTELIILGTQANINKLGPDYSAFSIDGNVIKVSREVKTLGFYLDSTLSFTKQVNSLASTTAYTCKLIRAGKPFLSNTSCLILARALILSRLDYCNALYSSANKANTQRLQTLQNNALRAALGIKKREHISSTRRQHKWLSTENKIQLKMISLTHKALNNAAPSYLMDKIKRKTSNRPMRLANSNCLAVPRFRLAKIGGVSFLVKAANLWNALPPNLRADQPFPHFRRNLIKHIIANNDLTPEHSQV